MNTHLLSHVNSCFCTAIATQLVYLKRMPSYLLFFTLQKGAKGKKNYLKTNKNTVKITLKIKLKKILLKNSKSAF